MCFGCSQEPSHPDGSFEYPQHINKKNPFQLCSLILGPENVMCWPHIFLSTKHLLLVYGMGRATITIAQIPKVTQSVIYVSSVCSIECSLFQFSSPKPSAQDERL